MKKSILSLALVALLGLFMTGCTPEVVITGTEDIIVDLGASDADVLANVVASNGDEVTVTGINYDEAGEHNATFTAGDVTEDAVVKIKTDKVIGSYEYTVTGDEEIYESEITQSSTVYNKILVGGIIEGNLEATCSGKILTFASTNLSFEDGTSATLTGTGTFEKIEAGYQVNSATFTLTFDDNSTEVMVYTFEKQ